VGLCHDQALLHGESQMENQIQIPLNLPDVRVLEAGQTLKSEWLIRVESVAGGTTCRKCGERITEFHGLDAPLRLRHLPLFEVPVYLELRPKRYRCRRCAVTALILIVIKQFRHFPQTTHHGPIGRL
jgi:transposase